MTKDTEQEQRLEIVIKIAHQYLQALIKYCNDNNVDSITKDVIKSERVVKFDMLLTERLLISRREVEVLMMKGCDTLADILIDVLKEENVDRLKLSTLEDFEKKWDWKEIFKGITNPND
jgi:hypothetical protein